SHTVALLHAVPFATGVFTQPVPLHESVVQGLPSSQEIGVPAAHAPLRHVSSPLHPSPSEHDVPFAATVFWHCPPTQESTVHGFVSLQSAGTPHGWQPAIGVWMQPLKALQLSVVHALPSLQFIGVPGAHVPPEQASSPLHTVASWHEVPFGTATCWQPV